MGFCCPVCRAFSFCPKTIKRRQVYMKKRILAVILTLVMLLGMVPVSALFTIAVARIMYKRGAL